MIKMKYKTGKEVMKEEDFQAMMAHELKFNTHEDTARKLYYKSLKLSRAHGKIREDKAMRLLYIFTLSLSCTLTIAVLIQ